MKIVIIGVEPLSLSNFRGDLIKELVSQGHEIITMANDASDTQVAELEEYGARYINYSVSRTGLNPFSDIKTLLAFIKCFRLEAPDSVLSYTIKPVIWGSIASSIFPRLNFFGMITGLGYAFGKGGALRWSVQFVVMRLYKFSLAKCKRVIFQNSDNKQEFVDRGLVSESKADLVQGSGVNLEHFFHVQPNITDGRVRFLMVARLLGDKGIREFLAAAKVVKTIYDNVDFVLVGPEDSSPDAVSLEEIMTFERDGVISYKGSVADIRPFIIDCSIFVLPSYHEGMPRTVLEAMAIGRPIITTDVPGCRETVVNGINGWLVPKCSIDELSRKMMWFVNRPHKIRPMGKLSRDMVERRFDVRIINSHIIKIITES